MNPRWSPRPGSIHSRQELLDRGIHSRRLASDEFVRVLPGYYCVAEAPAPVQVVSRVLQRMVLPGACISHATAAELLELPVPFADTMRESQVLHCTVAPGDRRRAGKNVIVHRRALSGTVRIRGVQVTAAVPTLLALAESLDHSRLVACVDHVLGPNASRRARADRDDLRAELARHGAARGVRALRAAVEDARDRVESPMETELRLLLRAEGFAEPTINLEVVAPGSEARFRLDLSYPQLRIAIEYDGDGHRVDKAQYRRDRRKDDILHEMGWRVVRVTAADLKDPRELVARLHHLGAPCLRR